MISLKFLRKVPLPVDIVENSAIGSLLLLLPWNILINYHDLTASDFFPHNSTLFLIVAITRVTHIAWLWCSHTGFCCLHGMKDYHILLQCSHSPSSTNGHSLFLEFTRGWGLTPGLRYLQILLIVLYGGSHPSVVVLADTQPCNANCMLCCRAGIPNNRSIGTGLSARGQHSEINS